MFSKYLRFFIKEYLFTLIAAIFVVVYWYSAHDLPFEAIRYSLVITVIAVVFIIWNLVMSVLQFRKVYHEEGDDKEKYDLTFGLTKERIGVIIATVMYGVLVPVIGFFVTTFLYLMGLSYYLGAKNRLIVLIYATVLTGLIYAIFRVWLHVRTPTDLFF